MRNKKLILGSFRVVTGQQHYAGYGEYIATAFHMTFYAKDIRTLKLLITLADCPTGTIYLADQIQESSHKNLPERVEFSAN